MLTLALPETEVQYILTASRQVQHSTRIAEIIHESIPCHLSFQSRTTSYYYCIKIVEITITIAYILLHFCKGHTSDFRSLLNSKNHFSSRNSEKAH